MKRTMRARTLLFVLWFFAAFAQQQDEVPDEVPAASAVSGLRLNLLQAKTTTARIMALEMPVSIHLVLCAIWCGSIRESEPANTGCRKSLSECAPSLMNAGMPT